MCTLQCKCTSCHSEEFMLQRPASASMGGFECCCANCYKHIAFISDYGIDWIKEDGVDDSKENISLD